MKVMVAAIALVGVMANAAAAQDAKTIVSAASKAMGVDGLNSIHYYGVAQNGNLGDQGWGEAGRPLDEACAVGAQPAFRAQDEEYRDRQGELDGAEVAWTERPRKVGKRAECAKLTEAFAAEQNQVANDKAVTSQTVNPHLIPGAVFAASRPGVTASCGTCAQDRPAGSRTSSRDRSPR